MFRVEGSWELRVDGLQGFRVQDKRGRYTRAFPSSETGTRPSKQIGEIESSIVGSGPDTEREGERESERGRRKRERANKRERGRERERQRERGERICLFVCLCVCEREIERVVCVCERERYLHAGVALLGDSNPPVQPDRID